MKTFGDYHDLYLKTDVLLLSDIFENFRKLCLDYYKLDPVHYYGTPGIAWDALLKMTRPTLELLRDPDIHLFLEREKKAGCLLLHIDMLKLIINTWKIMMKQKNHLI